MNTATTPNNALFANKKISYNSIMKIKKNNTNTFSQNNNRPVTESVLSPPRENEEDRSALMNFLSNMVGDKVVHVKNGGI